MFYLLKIYFILLLCNIFIIYVLGVIEGILVVLGLYLCVILSFFFDIDDYKVY